MGPAARRLASFDISPCEIPASSACKSPTCPLAIYDCGLAIRPPSAGRGNPLWLPLPGYVRAPGPPISWAGTGACPYIVPPSTAISNPQSQAPRPRRLASFGIIDPRPAANKSGNWVRLAGWPLRCRQTAPRGLLHTPPAGQNFRRAAHDLLFLASAIISSDSFTRYHTRDPVRRQVQKPAFFKAAVAGVIRAGPPLQGLGRQPGPPLLRFLGFVPGFVEVH